MASDVTSTNGELPPAREAIVEQGLRISQEVAAERDSLRLLLSERDTTIAGLKAQLEIAELAMSQMGNRTADMMAARDEAVARRAEVETVLGSMMAIGRAFRIANEPLIKEVEDAEVASPSIPAARNPSDVG
jgi:hypothetical protein